MPYIDDEHGGQCERVDIEGLERMNINGFTPVIFQIVPLTNLNLLLGLMDPEKPLNTTRSEEPSDLSFNARYRDKFYCKEESENSSELVYTLDR